MSGDGRQGERLAAMIGQALTSADLDAYADLLHPQVRWGAPGNASPPCQNRAQVLAWYRAGRDAGMRARVTETAVAGDKILVGMRVSGAEGEPDTSDEANRWQVLTLRDGMVADIRGFDNRDEAVATAGFSGDAGQAG